MAHIGLNDEEVAQMSLELSRFVDLVDQLQSVDTSGIEPTDQVTGLVDVMRADEIKPSKLSREQLLTNAPEQENGYIKVRRVL